MEKFDQVTSERFIINNDYRVETTNPETMTQPKSLDDEENGGAPDVHRLTAFVFEG